MKKADIYSFCSYSLLICLRHKLFYKKLLLAFMEYSLKKSLGQHFLKDENVCKRIVAELQKHQFDRLLEVGPGGGALTKYLLKIPAIDFKAVELDEEKVGYLEKTYPSIQGKIISRSFLDIDVPFTDSFTVVGNFP